MLHAQGKGGLEKDDVTAATWLKFSAEQGNADAQNNLGFLYKQGRGVTQNDTQAASWFNEAAAQGHADAQYNYGKMLQDGRGVPKARSRSLLAPTRSPSPS